MALRMPSSRSLRTVKSGSHATLLKRSTSATKLTIVPMMRPLSGFKRYSIKIPYRLPLFVIPRVLHQTSSPAAIGGEPMDGPTTLGWWGGFPPSRWGGNDDLSAGDDGQEVSRNYF